jgi:hypothetical protein
MDNTAVVKRFVDRVLLADGLDPVLHLLADDLSFKVAVPGSPPMGFGNAGKRGVVDYFEALGGIVTFWQVEYLARGDQMIAVGKERFTTRNALTADTDFALVFDVHHGLITGMLVVEDLTWFLQDGTPLLALATGVEDPAAAKVLVSA